MSNNFFKYNQSNKEKLQKNASKRYQSLSKEEKRKNDNTVGNNTKTYQKLKNKSLLSIEKILENEENY